MNLANILTMSRIVLTIGFIYFLKKDGVVAVLVAGILFWFASLTDYFDGYVAKKRNLVTNFGKIMDPIADKFLMLSAFFIFMQINVIPFWMFFVIFGREIIVTIFRLVAICQGRFLAAEKAGKLKTVFQVTSVSVILCYLMLVQLKDCWNIPEYIYSWAQWGVTFLMLVTVCLTLVSGLTTMLNYRKGTQ